jgi:hypothetical protein
MADIVKLTERKIVLPKDRGFWYYIKIEQYMGFKKRKGTEGVPYERGFGYQKDKLKANGYLIAPDGRYWRARTGGHAKGAIPDGFYKIERPRDPHNPNKRPFKDGRGFYWICDTPSPYVKALLGRSAFGIHPDGGSAGTAGCIGLLDDDTRPAHNALRDTVFRSLIVRPQDKTDDELRAEVEALLAEEDELDLLPE